MNQCSSRETLPTRAVRVGAPRASVAGAPVAWLLVVLSSLALPSLAASAPEARTALVAGAASLALPVTCLVPPIQGSAATTATSPTNPAPAAAAGPAVSKPEDAGLEADANQPPDAELDSDSEAESSDEGVDAPVPLSSESTPSTALSLSIGTPNAGLLLNPVPMPAGELWTLRDAPESYGTAETVEYLRSAIEAVSARYPGSPRVVIGDISRADGGRLNRHASHQSGRDADVGFFYRNGEVPDFLTADARNLDAERTWALVRAFVTLTDVERIFIDRSLQRVLYDHALSIGEDQQWLDDVFGRRTAGQGAIIQHEKRHKNHMHVRFYNPRAQDCGRQSYRQLLAAGLIPPPTVLHRVGSGETLNGLARRYGVRASAIRAANGLHSSFLRAGRRYVIPVRRAPAEPVAVVIPPRKIPPSGPGSVAESVRSAP